MLDHPRPAPRFLWRRRRMLRSRILTQPSQRRERARARVFEVLEPASQHGVEAADDGLHAVTVVALGESANVVLELLGSSSRPLGLTSKSKTVRSDVRSKAIHWHLVPSEHEGDIEARKAR